MVWSGSSGLAGLGGVVVFGGLVGFLVVVFLAQGLGVGQAGWPASAPGDDVVDLEPGDGGVTTGGLAGAAIAYQLRSAQMTGKQPGTAPQVEDVTVSPDHHPSESTAPQAR